MSDNKWEKVGSMIASFAPIIGGALAGPGGAVVGKIVADKLRVSPVPDVVQGALENMSHAERDGLRELEQSYALANSVNVTMRTEVKSEDQYVRRWRPTFGYVMAISWGLEFLIVVVCCLWATYMAATGDANAGETVFLGMVDIIQASVILWGFALPVIGVAVHQRSKDKARALGIDPGSIISKVAKTLQK